MPLTERQIAYYQKRWIKTSGWNQWRMVGGRLLCDREAPGQQSYWHRLVWSWADRSAAEHHRAVTAEDLRRACNAAALGRFIDSTTKIGTSREFTRLLLLLGGTKCGPRNDIWTEGLLNSADDTDANAAYDWGAPELHRRREYVIVIRSLDLDEAYIDRICRDQFQGRYNPPHWEDLPENDLLNLVRTAKERSKAHRAEREPAPF